MKDYEGVGEIRLLCVFFNRKKDYKRKGLFFNNKKTILFCAKDIKKRKMTEKWGVKNYQSFFFRIGSNFLKKL